VKLAFFVANRRKEPSLGQSSELREAKHVVAGGSSTTEVWTSSGERVESADATTRERTSQR